MGLLNHRRLLGRRRLAVAETHGARRMKNRGISAQNSGNSAGITQVTGVRRLVKDSPRLQKPIIASRTLAGRQQPTPNSSPLKGDGAFPIQEPSLPNQVTGTRLRNPTPTTHRKAFPRNGAGIQRPLLLSRGRKQHSNSVTKFVASPNEPGQERQGGGEGSELWGRTDRRKGAMEERASPV
uniref:Uncharacterized protein n=1 Tax=Arundo donax TaxID=35708 RepID=A0A0A9BQE8_ARUDO